MPPDRGPVEVSGFKYRRIPAKSVYRSWALSPRQYPAQANEFPCNLIEQFEGNRSIARQFTKRDGAVGPSQGFDHLDALWVSHMHNPARHCQTRLL